LVQQFAKITLVTIGVRGLKHAVHGPLVTHRL